MPELRNQVSGIQRLLEHIWYRNSLLRYPLLPISALFCFVSTWRRRQQTRHQLALGIPIIVVGNINIGGTGKTPLVLYLVKLLQQLGHKPAIISRGYKSRKDHSPLLVDAHTPVEDCGDEALQMALQSGVPVITGANRVDDIQFAQQHTQCTLIISDDGLQHYRMKRDVEIVVVDAQRQFGNGHCLPAGPLREKPARLQQCHFIVTNGNATLGLGVNEYRMKIQASDVLINVISGEKRPFGEFNLVQIITAIGNPQRFIDTMTELGLAISSISTFPDHHFFSAHELISADKNPVVMTEKDAVKCKTLEVENCWYLPVEARLDGAFDVGFCAQIKAIS